MTSFWLKRKLKSQPALLAPSLLSSVSSRVSGELLGVGPPPNQRVAHFRTMTFLNACFIFLEVMALVILPLQSFVSLQVLIKVQISLVDILCFQKIIVKFNLVLFSMFVIDWFSGWKNSLGLAPKRWKEVSSGASATFSQIHSCLVCNKKTHPFIPNIQVIVPS